MGHFIDLNTDPVSDPSGNMLFVDFDNPWDVAEKANWFGGSNTPLALEGALTSGDSGGGIFMDTAEGLKLIGVDSGAYPQNNGKYGVVTRIARVSSHIDWINSTIARFESGIEPLAGLIARWDFKDLSEGYAQDVSGTGHRGNVVDAEHTDGKIGQGIYFFARPSEYYLPMTSQDYVEVPNNNLGHYIANDLKLTDDFSIAAWVYRVMSGGAGGETTDIDTIVAKVNPDGTGSTDYAFIIWEDHLRFYGSSGAYVSSQAHGIEYEKWAHVMVTREAGTVNFYVDGQLKGTDTLGEILATSDQSLIIGNSPDTGLNFSGKMDDVRIYDRLLSQQDGQNLVDLAGISAGHWKLDETSGTEVSDSSVNGNNSTLMGDPIWEPAGGIDNGALLFTGQNDYINVPLSESIDFSTTDFTFATWIKPSGSTTRYVGLFGTGDPINGFLPGGKGFRLYYKDNEKAMNFWFNNGLIGSFDGSLGGYYTNSLYDGAWHHIALTVDRDGNASIYIDAQLEISMDMTPFPGGDLVGDTPLRIGAWGDYTSECFEGLMDDARVYAYALTGNEVFDLVNAGSKHALQANDDTAVTQEDTPIVIDVLANDSSEGDNTLFVDSITQPFNGTAVINFDDTITYTPNTGYDGEDTFTYIAVVDVEADQATVSITVEAILNQAPSVNAGQDQSLTLPSTLQLAGTASDDGLPSSPGQVSYQWNMISGPGTVVFTSPGESNSEASFSLGGTYTLRLTASDGELQSSDDLQVTVLEPIGAILTSPPTGTVIASSTVTFKWFGNSQCSLYYVGLWSGGTFIKARVVGEEERQLILNNIPLGPDVRIQLGGLMNNSWNFKFYIFNTWVAQVNQAPSVNAGQEQSLTLPSTLHITRTASNDGLPSSPGQVSYQ